MTAYVLGVTLITVLAHYGDITVGLYFLLLILINVFAYHKYYILGVRKVRPIVYKVGEVINQKTQERIVKAYDYDNDILLAIYSGYENYKSKTITLYPKKIINTNCNLITTKHTIPDSWCD